jgi:hypothetical protein
VTTRHGGEGRGARWESNSKPRDDAKRESDGFRKLRHAVEKAPGDRDRAIRNVCRLYGVKTVEALPGAIRVATSALLHA